MHNFGKSLEHRGFFADGADQTVHSDLGHRRNCALTLHEAEDP